MRLQEILDGSGHIEIRKANRFGLCNKVESRQLFIESFLLTDQTVTKEEFKNIPEYKEIISWLEDNEGKGLFMSGSVGRGKSTILKGVLPLIFLAKMNKIMKPISARDLHNHEYKNWIVAIDDMGQDDVVKDYGTSINAVEDAISYCEDKMKLLFITSNLTKKQIENKYGKRVMDRIERLCKIVVFKGDSFRK